MNPAKDTRRCTPPLLLPSTSLGGLEQFVPPGSLPQSSFRQPWRLKPLPQLPSEVSSASCRRCGGEEFVGGSYVHINVPVSEQRVNNQQPFLDEQPKLEDVSQHNIHSSGPNQAAGGGDVQVTSKRPTSYGKSGRWSPFPAQKPPPQARALRNSTGFQRVPLAKGKVRSTGDLTHKSLVPEPLDVENGRQRSPGRDRHYSLRAPASADFDRFRSVDHISHSYSTLPRPECSHHGRQGQPPVSWSSINSATSRPNVVQNGSIHPRKSGNQSTIQVPSSTDLLSSSTSTTANRNTYGNGNYAGYRHEITKIGGAGEAPYNTTFSGYPFTPDSRPAHPNPNRTRAQRPKQLAIPPTEYQKHGPKIWSSQNKQYRAELFPRCFRKFLPRSWRPSEDHKAKNGKRQQKQGMEKILSNIVVPSPNGSQPPPPRPPRPPTSSSPATLASPALPYLTFPGRSNARDYFCNLTPTPSDTAIDRLKPTHALRNLVASSSATNLSRETDSRKANPYVDYEAEMEVRRARSEVMLGSGPVPAMVDSTGNYWL